jgi:hypothetical protein
MPNVGELRGQSYCGKYVRGAIHPAWMPYSLRPAQTRPATEALHRYFWPARRPCLTVGTVVPPRRARDSVSWIQENVDVHEQFWEQLAGLGRAETARRAGCGYLPESDAWSISLLNREYRVDPINRTIQAVGPDSGARPAGYLEQLCILAYLVNARDLPLAGRLISVEKLDPGGFFFRGSHKLQVEKLTAVFGPDPQLLHQAGRQFDAESRPFGDAAIELCVLPRIPLTLIVWAADEEFPARTSILFDQTATAQLPLDALFAAATLTINVLLSVATTGS